MRPAVDLKINIDLVLMILVLDIDIMDVTERDAVLAEMEDRNWCLLVL